MQKPTEFFKVRVHDLSLSPGLIGLCVGYELNEWRYDGLVDHLMEWMPEFCLTYEEIENIDSGNVISLMREAFRKLYTSGKFQNRGEFGELMLHAAIRQVFGSIPAISKIYYKSSANNTVKGFDAVHVVPNEGSLELWLGEVKFYKDINAAIRDVVEELEEHTNKNYLRDEFLLIKGKIDSNWPYAQKLERMLDPNVSLDEVFQRVVIPVLLTYESSTVNNFSVCNDDYKEKFIEELASNHVKFSGKQLPRNVVIHLILVPLKSKKNLIAKLDGKLKIWQAL